MKKILIALVSVTLLAGCSADGVFYGGSLENPNVEWSNEDDDTDHLVYCSIGSYCGQTYRSECYEEGGTVVSSCSSNPNSNLINCSLGGSCYSQVPQYECIQAGGTVVSSCSSNPSTSQYCYYDGDCDLIGGYFTHSASQCTSERHGTIKSRQECINLGADIYDDL